MVAFFIITRGRGSCHASVCSVGECRRGCGMSRPGLFGLLPGLYAPPHSSFCTPGAFPARFGAPRPAAGKFRPSRGFFRLCRGFTPHHTALFARPGLFRPVSGLHAPRQASFAPPGAFFAFAGALRPTTQLFLHARGFSDPFRGATPRGRQVSAPPEPFKLLPLLPKQKRGLGGVYTFT